MRFLSSSDRAAVEQLCSQYSIYFDRFRQGVLPRGSFLNSASHSIPVQAAFEAGEAVFQRESQGKISSEEQLLTFGRIRQSLAKIVRAPDPKNCALTLNTTAGVTLAGHLLGWPQNPAEGKPKMLALYDRRGYEPTLDQIFGQGRGIADPRTDFRMKAMPHFWNLLHPDKVAFQLAQMVRRRGQEHYNISEDLRFKEITRHFNWPPLVRKANFVVLNHVSRDGEVTDLETVCGGLAKINPEIGFIVDGAQAVGSVNVDLTRLMRRFPRMVYVFSANKALGGSEGGAIVFNPDDPIIKENLSYLAQCDSYPPDWLWVPILPGMFDPRIMKPNTKEGLALADWVTTWKAIQYWEQHGLKGNDFSAISGQRRSLRFQLIEKLNALSEKMKLKITVKNSSSSSDSILCIRIPDVYDAAWFLLQRGIFVSPLPLPAEIRWTTDSPQPQGWLRISFQPMNTSNEIDHFVGVLQEYLVRKKSERNLLRTAGRLVSGMSQWGRYWCHQLELHFQRNYEEKLRTEKFRTLI